MDAATVRPQAPAPLLRSSARHLKLCFVPDWRDNNSCPCGGGDSEQEEGESGLFLAQITLNSFWTL